MRRVLLMTTPEKGHVNPMMGVAQWLRRDGHEVGWLCIPEPAPEIARAGFELVSPALDLPRPHLATHGAEIARLVRDAGALRGWIRTLLLDAVPAQIEPLRATLRAFRPDVVALDPMLYQGIIACHLEGTPYAGISSSLNPVAPPDLDSDLVRTVAALSPARDALFAAHGIAPLFRVCDGLSPHVNTVFATRELVGDVELPPRTHLVGPSTPPEPRGDEAPVPWERLPPDRPVVYASFGSQISWQPEIFRRIASACRSLGASLVLSAGDLAAEMDGDGVVAMPYVGQLSLLPRCAAFVTHGGANSVMEALVAGVPMLVSPVCNDQPHQARFVAAAGAGLVLDLHDAPVAQIGDALGQLLHADAPQRGAARRIAEAYGRHDGARRAAELVAAVP